jgi:hypothetical protein
VVAVSDWVTISDHAAERWLQRSDLAGRIGPRCGWLTAQRINDHELDADEVRYHDEAEVLLLAKESTLVTVLSVDESAGSECTVCQTSAGQRGGRDV